MVNRKVLAFVLGLSLVLMPQTVVAQNVDRLFNRGVEAGNTGRYREAERMFRQILEIEPNNAIAYYNLGNALYRQGKLAEAIVAYQKAIQLDPDYADAYNNLGLALEGQGKLEEAIAAYQIAIQLYPDYANTYNNLGLALEGQGKLEEAIAAYQIAIQLYPNFTIAYNNLGTALRNQGKLEEAVATYQQAIQLDPNYAGAYNNLGLALKRQGKLEEAIAAYQIAIQLAPNYRQPQNNLKEAERLLALRLNPPPPDIKEILPNPEEQPFFPLQRSVVLIIDGVGSRGTGWVIKRDNNKAWIVTNGHVISNEEGSKHSLDNIEIELYSLLPPEQRLRLPAKVAHATNPTDPLALAVLDLAVLEVANLPEDIQPLSLAPSPVALDADVRIIGHPITGSPWSMLRGYISATIASPEGKDIQIAGADLAIGNSGSPVLYDRQVVAVVVEIGNEASAATGQDPRSTGGFGFAYPIRTVLQQLQEWGVYP